MESSRIADLLRPFLGGNEVRPELPDQLRLYLELLLKWNARVNLTAVRDPEHIVARHFGNRSSPPARSSLTMLLRPCH